MSLGLRPFLLGLPGFEALCRRLTRRHVRVLMYHRVAPDPAADSHSLPLVKFRRQLKYLAGVCQVVDPDTQNRFEAGDFAGDGRPLAVITIDDGYTDFRDYMVPVFRDLGIPATLFVTTGFVGGESWMWWDKVNYIIEETDQTEVSFEFGSGRLTGRLADPGERRRFWSVLVPALRFVPDQDKENAIFRLAEQLGVDLPAVPPDRYAAVSWEDLEAMYADGVNLGGHTRTHPILSRCDDERAAAEIDGSRRDLAAHLGTGTNWFAYPQGGPADHTAITADLVREAGFRGAYVAYCDPRLVGNAYTKIRYHVDGDFTGFRWTVCGADWLILRLRRLFGRNTGVSDGYWLGADLAAAETDGKQGGAPGGSAGS